MYAVVTWEIDSAAPDPDAIASDAAAAFGDRLTCTLFRGAHIARVGSTTDFVLVHEALARVADAHPGKFRYAAWALRGASPMRTSEPLDRDLAGEITGA